MYGLRFIKAEGLRGITRAKRLAMLDYNARWGIEPHFADFKSRGFQLEKTQVRDPQRIGRMVLIMALAMYGCVQTGWDQAVHQPTPTEKKPLKTPDPIISASVRPHAVRFLGSSAAYRGRETHGE